MTIRERMARAGYERAIRRPIPGVEDAPSFNAGGAVHRWENQSEQLRDLWRAVADEMLDILSDASDDLSKNAEWDGVVWQALITAIRDNK